jgi:hypothetical protein
VSPDDHQNEVAIARIEASLLTIKNQIDYSERSAAQMVGMVKESVNNRFDAIDRRLDEMDRSRQSARLEDTKWKDSVERRLTLLEKFNVRLIGICIGVSVATGGVTATIVKAVGE